MMAVTEVFECVRSEQLDDERVDIRYALGFGGASCVQADFLIPAMMAMAI